MAANGPPPEAMEYSAITQRISARAIVSVVVGILAVPGGLLVVGFPLGIAALVFGMAALGQINGDPARFRGRAMALSGVCMGIVGLGAAPVVMASLFLTARESMNRSDCAANQRGIVQTMRVYASDNGNCFP